MDDREEWQGGQGYQCWWRDIIIITIIIIYPWEFFSSVLADGLSLLFEWQQASSSLQDTGRSQYCSNLDGRYQSSNF